MLCTLFVILQYAQTQERIFRESFPVHRFITPIESAPLSLPPHRIRSYAMWILLIVENENVGSSCGLHWHNVHTKRNENRPTALSVLTA